METFEQKFNGKLPARCDVPAEFCWKREDLFADHDAWDRAVEEATAAVEAFKAYENTVQDKDTFVKLMDAYLKLSETVANIYYYAMLGKDQDLSDTARQEDSNRAENLIVAFDEAAAFVTPEILALPEELLLSIAKKEPLYDYFLKDLLRKKAHVLTKEQEAMLSAFGQVFGAPEHVFDMLSSTDLKFPDVKNEKGELTPLSENTFALFRMSADRTVRKEGFEALFGGYKKVENTMAALLSTEVKKHIASAKVRKYPSARAAALSGDNIPEAVYDNLIDTIHKNFAPMHRYMELRRKTLGVEKLKFYDLYAPFGADARGVYPYETGKELILKGLSPLGEEYGKFLAEGLNGGWADIYPNVSKQSGAYCLGSAKPHPFVLLNYTDNLDSVMTTAHEFGHALHSYYGNRTQPYLYRGNSIFTAEVASTTNEVLMTRYLLRTLTDKQDKIAVLVEFLEQIRTTIYRQTLFAEFENTIHRWAAEGQALTAEKLNALWHELNVAYYGPALDMDAVFDVEWARIPHFYMDHYVFQYATGLSAAIEFASRIEESEEKRDAYIGFLKAAGSADPIDILKTAGVDMATPAAVERAAGFFAELLTELEKLMEE